MGFSPSYITKDGLKPILRFVGFSPSHIAKDGLKPILHQSSPVVMYFGEHFLDAVRIPYSSRSA